MGCAILTVKAGSELEKRGAEDMRCGRVTRSVRAAMRMVAIASRLQEREGMQSFMVRSITCQSIQTSNKRYLFTLSMVDRLKSLNQTTS